MKCKDSISGRVLVVLRSSFFVVREGYGFLRKPIYIVRSAHGLLACISAVRDCTQAVTLQFRHVPVFPALREPVPPRGGHSVFPALRGKGRSAALYPEDLYFLYT